MTIKKIINTDLFKSLALTLGVCLIALLPIIQILNDSSYNQKFRFRGPVTPSDQIAIVAIDDESITWLNNNKWPWPRSYHAKIVDTLRKAGAKVVIFDVFFDSATQFDPHDDVEFSDSIKKAGNVVLAASFQNMTESNEFKVVKIPFKRPIPMLDKAALDIGVVHPHIDADNFVRRFQLIYKWAGQYYPSLSLDAIQYLLPKPSFKVVNNNLIICGPHQIKLDRAKMLVNYYGPAGTFKTVPYGRLYDGTFLADFPNFFKDKIVLIGATTIDLHDVFPTPFYVPGTHPRNYNMPGVEIHANVIQTILDDKYIVILPFIFVFLLMWIPVWINFRISANLKIKQFFGLAFLQVFMIYTFSFLVFKYLRTEIPTYTLILAILLTFLTQTIIKFLREEREKRKVRDIFSQYVAPSVVNELLAHPEKVELGGELKEVTIFFSDIRSFTTFSEAHTPKEVVELLNEYLDAMTQVIFEHGGTLDKYVGDEIMAVFGAPLPLENHAVIAVECCVHQYRKLKELQAKWKAEGKSILDMGMGLNTGQVVVGNIGSSQHKDYTVIGDAVNLAARLEAATRNYSTPDRLCYLLISEFTYNLVKDKFPCKLLDEIAVKGKTEKTKIYEVMVDEMLPA